jgi:hypothetical protein
MKYFIRVSSGLIAILLLGPLVTEVMAAPDMTGTWSGTASCSGIVNDVDKQPIDVAITLAISHSGEVLHADITLNTTDFTGDLNGTHRYRGELNKRGKKALIEKCGTTFGPKGSFNGVIGELKVITKKKDPTPYLKGDLLNLDEPDSAVACVFDELTDDGSTPVIGPCPP